MDEQKLYLMLGNMQADIKSVKEDTKDLPALTTRVALAEDKILIMGPKVDRHQKVMFLGFGGLGVLGILWNAIQAWYEGGGHK